jgi:hypothetical protein
MGHYIANLRDIEFCLFDLFERESILGKSIYKDLDRETAMGMLEEVKRMAENDLAASFIDGDRLRELSLIQKLEKQNCQSHLKNLTKHLWIMSGGELMHLLN